MHHRSVCDVKTCLYTAAFGGHVPREPLIADSSIDMICFTDNPAAVHAAAPAWQVIERRRRFAHPRMDAKWFRMNAAVELSEYDTVVWADASFQFGNVGEFVRSCTRCLYNNTTAYKTAYSGTAFFVHPERSDIWTEAESSLTIWRQKYSGEPLREQVERYKALGLGEHQLWACGIQARNNQDPLIAKLDQLWFRECMRWSYQDQLSLPFVLWRMGLTPGTIPGDIYVGPEHRWAPGEDF